MQLLLAKKQQLEIISLGFFFFFPLQSAEQSEKEGQLRNLELSNYQERERRPFDNNPKRRSNFGVITSRGCFFPIRLGLDRRVGEPLQGLDEGHLWGLVAGRRRETRVWGGGRGGGGGVGEPLDVSYGGEW